MQKDAPCINGKAYHLDLRASCHLIPYKVGDGLRTGNKSVLSPFFTIPMKSSGQNFGPFRFSLKSRLNSIEFWILARTFDFGPQSILNIFVAMPSKGSKQTPSGILARFVCIFARFLCVLAWKHYWLFLNFMILFLLVAAKQTEM